jgi:hypothetical protein
MNFIPLLVRVRKCRVNEDPHQGEELAEVSVGSARLLGCVPVSVHSQSIDQQEQTCPQNCARNRSPITETGRS